MEVATMNVDKQAALMALRTYKECRSKFDAKDLEIERIYRAISRGKVVISVNDAIRQAGLDQQGRPLLAISRADATRVRCLVSGTELRFSNPEWGGGRWELTVPGMPQGNWQNIQALLPRIPPQHRPDAKHLKNYHVLWEADWTAIPRDPYLLKRIGKDAWVVLAAWELSDVEISVIRAHQPRQ